MSTRPNPSEVHHEDKGQPMLFGADHTAAPATVAPSPPTADPFDPASLRLDSNYAAWLGVKKMLTTVPVRKPGRQEWFRVRPGDDWRLQTAAYEDESLRETYLVAPPLWSNLPGQLQPTLIVTAISRAGDLFLWRLKLPGPDGRPNSWTDSALAIAQEAETGWRRMTSNMAAGYYEGFVPEAVLPDPEWPDRTFHEILRTAFKGRMIESQDHPLLRQLRGES